MTDEQFLVIASLLSEIRDALHVGQDEPVDVGCQHPEDKRVSLATPRDQDHWVCSIPTCRHEHRGVTHN